ncbi:MAG: hypothetical protein JNK63_08595 [Chthonomonas sp.]|nr:hypothetical protein [Chthonomonas sp.]
MTPPIPTTDLQIGEFQIPLPIAAALVGLLGVGLGLFIKPMFDKAAERRAARRAFHLKRAEHLSKIIAGIIEYRAIAPEAREAHIEADNRLLFPPSFQPGEADPRRDAIALKSYDLAHEYRKRLNGILSTCLVEAELYGDIPTHKNMKKLKSRHLIDCVQCFFYYKFMDLIVRDSNRQDDAWRHSQAFTVDLRALATMETECANRLAFKPGELPYIEKFDDSISFEQVDVRGLDISTMIDALLQNAHPNGTKS